MTNQIQKTPNFSTSNIEVSFINDLWGKLVGRRHADLNYIFKSIQLIDHISLDCTVCKMEFVKETRTGFLRILNFKCKIYSLDENIQNENDNTYSKIININLAIASATVNTDQGYGQLEKKKKFG